MRLFFSMYDTENRGYITDGDLNKRLSDIDDDTSGLVGRAIRSMANDGKITADSFVEFMSLESGPSGSDGDFGEIFKLLAMGTASSFGFEELTRVQAVSRETEAVDLKMMLDVTGENVVVSMSARSFKDVLGWQQR